MFIFDRSNLFASVVADYFETLNRGHFIDTASLFATDGILLLPTDDPVVGQTAIATYLATYEQDRYSRPRSYEVTVLPEQSVPEQSVPEQIQVQVWGEASVPPFGVPVVWLFLLDQEGKIQQLQIHLLPNRGDR